MVTGTKTVCFALTERRPGRTPKPSAPRPPKTATVGGSTGTSTTSPTPHADFAVVFAVTDAQKRAAGGITAFLVPADQFRRGPTQWNISDTHPGELFFEDAWVPGRPRRG